MVEVRLFAGLREGRGKIIMMEPDSVKTVQDVMDVDEDPEEQEFQEQVVEDMSIKTASLELIEKVLRKHGGNRKAAAAELGISERTLYRKIKQITDK